MTEHAAQRAQIVAEIRQRLRQYVALTFATRYQSRASSNQSRAAARGGGKPRSGAQLTRAQRRRACDNMSH